MTGTWVRVSLRERGEIPDTLHNSFSHTNQLCPTGVRAHSLENKPHPDKGPTPAYTATLGPSVYRIATSPLLTELRSVIRVMGGRGTERKGWGRKKEKETGTMTLSTSHQHLSELQTRVLLPVQDCYRHARLKRQLLHYV